MARREAGKGLGRLEAEVMRALWSVGGPLSVRDLLERLLEDEE